MKFIFRRAEFNKILFDAAFLNSIFDTFTQYSGNSIDVLS